MEDIKYLLKTELEKLQTKESLISLEDDDYKDIFSEDDISYKKITSDLDSFEDKFGNLDFINPKRIVIIIEHSPKMKLYDLARIMKLISDKVSDGTSILLGDYVGENLTDELILKLFIIKKPEI